MSNAQAPEPQDDPVMLTLDQLQQTLDVMSSVVRRLKLQIEDQQTPHTPSDVDISLYH